MRPLKDDLEDLLSDIWRIVANTPDLVTGVRVDIPAVVPCETGIVESRYSEGFPVLDHLEETIKLARGHGLGNLAERFAVLAPSLRWSQNPSYTAENAGQALLDGYAYAALSGPEGPVHCAAPRGGFMLMGPDVTYPAHSHAPREVYLILTPGAHWSLDNGDWFEVGAGQLILHEPWVKHAMRTHDKPMLAFAGWVEPGNRLAIGFDD